MLIVRPIVTLAALAALLFLCVIAVIRAQPEATAVRAFLSPTENCAPPCWQGIQPGITTSSEVVAILEAHPWVGRVYLGGSQTDARIFWQWNGQEPDFARQLVSSFPDSYIYLYNNVVRYIRLSTRIPYGEVRSLLGAPDSGTFLPTTPNSFNALYFHTAGYFGGSVVFATNVSCPATPAGFWNDPVVITYNDGSYVSLSAMPPYNLIPWVYESDCTE